MKHKTRIFNFIAGPGAGKSTYASLAYHILKKQDYDVEMAPEFAREIILDDQLDMLKFQYLPVVMQAWRIRRWIGKIDAVVTDSPYLLGLYYGKDWPGTREMVLHLHKMDEAISDFIFLNRRSTFTENKGRIHTEEQAKEIDSFLKDELTKLKIPFYEMEVCQPWVEEELEDYLLARMPTQKGW